MTVARSLEEFVRSAQRAAMGMAALRVCSAATLAISVQWASGPSYGIWIAVLLYVFLESRRLPTGRESAADLDLRSGLPGELECAWDNRALVDPTARAQRRLAVDRLVEQRPARLAQWPHPGWLAPPLLCLGVVLGTESGTSFDAPGVGVEASEVSKGVDLDHGGTNSANETAETSRDSMPTRARAVAATPGEEEAGKGPTDVPQKPRAGVGQKAGDLSAGLSGIRELRSGGGEVEQIVLRASDGTIPIRGEASGRALAGQTPPPPNGIADPSRPYPRRYHRVIKAWFDRNKP
jgi:hypothetical protein